MTRIKRVNEMTTKLKLGKYKHFKGKDYDVIGIAKDCENLNDIVIYKSLYDSPEFKKGTLWTRPLKNFIETIDRDGKTFKRFEFVGE